MRLWTIQPIEVFEEINKKGYYICDKTKSSFLNDKDEYTTFLKPYLWLNKEMVARIGLPPKGVEFPVWAWYTRNWKHKKPDLREVGYAKKGTNCVCLEIEKADNAVVLTDFDAWHYVLNNSYNDNSTNEAEWEKEQKWFDSLSEKERVNVKYESWKKIFDITPFKNDWISNGSWVQATFWVLYLKDIKKIQYFTAK